MSEWLGRSRIYEEDIKKVQPSLAENFPALIRYWVDAQKMRIMLTLDYEEGDKFEEAVIKAYGSFNPTNVRKAAKEAIHSWINSHL